MIQSFSSRSFRTDRASQWLELLRTEMRWPVEFDSVNDRAFDAELECFTAGDLVLVDHRTSPLALRRIDVGEAGALQHFSLNFVTDGRMILSHHDRQNVVTSGCIVFADSRKPSRLTFEESTRVVTMRIPRSVLVPHIPRPERLCNRVLSPRHDFSNAVRASLLSMLELGRSGVSDELRERSVQPFLGLLAFSYLANFGPHLAEDSSRDRLSRIRRYIDDNATNTGLTPEGVAAHFGLSSRYLRKLFAGEGESVARYIQRRRLEKSADRITNLLWRDQSITDICYDVGFKSPPHFTRAFKARFGVTPNEYRKRAVRIASEFEQHRGTPRV